MEVSWVTGRKKYLARAIAVHCAEVHDGKKWHLLTQAEMDCRIREVMEKLTEWAASDVLAEFQHPYREKK